MTDVALVDPVADEGPTSFALECLVIIGRRYGLGLTVSHLVKDNGLASADVTTEQLLFCAERSGFRCRALRARWDALSGMQGALPAIVRTTEGRHAVLLRVDHRDGLDQVVLQDPGAGADAPAVTMDRAAFETLWSGDVLLIKRSLGMTEKSRPFGFETVAAFLGADRKLVRELAVSTLALSALALVPVFFAQLVVTYVLSYPAFGTFFFLGLGVVILVAFEAAFLGVRRSVLGRLGARLEHDLSGYAFERLLHLPIDYFDGTAVGLTAQRMGQVSTVAASLSGRAVGTLLDAGVAAIALPVMAYYNLPLAAIVVLFGVVLAMWTRFMGGKIRLQTAVIEKVEAERSAFVSETIGAFATVRTLALDPRQRRRWDVLTARATRLRLAENGTANVLQSVATPLEWLMVYGTFGFGVYLASNAMVPATIGYLFAFLLLALRVAAPLRGLSTLVREQDAFHRSIATLATLMNEPLEAGHGGHGVRLPLRGRIEFLGVTFSYPGAPTPALQSVSFDVPVGTTLGIMGRSGSGKTSIARLIQKFHSDYQGLIKIDGIDARDYDIAHLRGSVGVVLQDTFLFGGTIRDNIVAARPDADDDEVAHAARMAGAESFIEKLPLGYQTPLQEGAVNLSDGQRQRIAIARAVIANPRVLILDEATSALDPESEAIVNANLKRFANGRTTIAISHRFSALANADQILVLDRGEVQDMGQHEELLERCDIYSGMWQRRKRLLEGPATPETLLPRGSHVA